MRFGLWEGENAFFSFCLWAELKSFSKSMESKREQHCRRYLLMFFLSGYISLIFGLDLAFLGMFYSRHCVCTKEFMHLME
jgi:hypothetical protein